jgi:hypothetical protein
MKHSPKCGKHGVSNDIIVALYYEQEDNNCALGIINPYCPVELPIRVNNYDQIIFVCN